MAEHHDRVPLGDDDYGNHDPEAQSDGTCPLCGRFVELHCSVHGHLEGDPWSELAHLRDLLAKLVGWANDGMAGTCPPDAIAALEEAYDVLGEKMP